MDDGVTFILDARPEAEQQIAVLGNFKDRRYGRFSIDSAQVESWQRNLSAVTGEPRVAVDYDHSSDDHRQSTRAAGWIKSLRLEGSKVLAGIDWTPRAREAIEQGEYRYFSPTFAAHHRLEDGTDVGATLLGGALTNRPFLRRGMRAVALSVGVEVEVDEMPQESHEPVYALALLTPEARDRLPASAFVFPEDRRYPIHDEAHARNALARVAQHGSPDEKAKVKAAVKKRYPDIGGGEEGSPEEESKESPDQEAAEDRKRKASDSPARMDDLIKRLGAALGISSPTEESVLAAVAELHKPGTISLSQDALTSLQADAQAGRAAQEELRTMRFDNAFSKALSQGRVVPALRDTYRELFDKAEEHALRLLADSPAAVHISAQGGGSGANDGSGPVPADIADPLSTYDVDPAQLAVYNRATRLSAEKGVDFEKALRLVQEGVAG